MATYILISILAGGVTLLVDEMSGNIPFAKRWLESYSSLRCQKIKLRRKIIVELAFGFSFAGFFLLFYRALPLQLGLPRAIFFAHIFWMPSSVCKAASDWAVFEVPASMHLYAMFVGLLKLLAVSLLFHLTLTPLT